MGLSLRFLGEFGVIRDGQPMALPPSRKTRALLAYLCLNRRRLRRLLDDEDRQRVRADRTSVEVDVQDVDIDVVALHALAGSSLLGASIEALEQAARRYRGNFLEELEFFNFHDFHAWCVAEREH